MGYNNTAYGNKNSTLEPCYYIDRVLNDAGDMVGVYTANIIFNALFSIAALLGNAVVIAAISKTSSLRSPSNILLLGLALSDFSVGLFVQPLYITYKLAGLTGHSSIHCSAGVAFNVVSSVLASVSVQTLTAVSVDIYLKITLHLRYDELVTTPRVLFTLAGLWLLSVLCSLTWLWNLRIFYIVGALGMVLCVLITSFTYLKIYHIVVYHRDRIKNLEGMATQSTSPQAVKMKENTKSALSMFLVYAVFLVCFLPFLCMLVVVTFIRRNTSTETALNFTMLLVFINSALNPVLVCWRMKDIRCAVLKVLGKSQHQTEPH